MLLQPSQLLFDLLRHLLLNGLQGRQGGVRVSAEGIGLNHPHVPAQVALFKRNLGKGQREKRRGQGRREHDAPARLQAVDGVQDRGDP